MSIFSAILDKIFHHATSAGSAATGASPGAANPNGVPAAPSATQPGDAANVGQTSTPSAAPTSLGQADVEATLKDLAAKKGGGGNWQTSIVDLLRLLDLNPSLDARKQLAEELNVHAGEHGSAEQNIALSKAVWQQLAQNGGKVPESLKA